MILMFLIFGSSGTYYYYSTQKKIIPDQYDCIDPVTNKRLDKFSLNEKEKKMEQKKRQEDFLWDCNNLVVDCVFTEHGCIVRPYYKEKDPTATTTTT